MAQNFHIAPVTMDKPKESSCPSTILQLVHGLAKALPGPVPVHKELEDGQNPKVATLVSATDADVTAKSAVSKEQIENMTNGVRRASRVVVVGAGISGLRAASVLKSHGIEVVVLEGRDRIGGRIFTSRKTGGAPRDIGKYCLGNTNNRRKRLR
jgi:NADPH-dependent 2,4-dienoyl-CoA reductase/sulfur reductase-like enzyme